MRMWSRGRSEREPITGEVIPSYADRKTENRRSRHRRRRSLARDQTVRHFQSADFGPRFGSGGRCNHAPQAPHAKGEWIGAKIRLQTPLLAQYAVSHYLEQDRVLDADVVG